MMLRRKTAVVVPCYNEARRLKLDEFRAALDATPLLTFVFVDDGSRDETASMLASFRTQAGDRVHLLELPENAGKAEAVRRGVLHAFERDFELVGYWDADLATPLRYIATFAGILDQANILLVMGSRVQLLGHKIERSQLRHYAGRGFATLASATLGIPIYDTQCGAKLFRAHPTIRRAFSDPFTLGWTFDVELLSRLLKSGSEKGGITLRDQCVEYPLEEWIDTPGSKLAWRHFPAILLDLAKMLGLARRRGAARSTNSSNEP